MRRLAARRSSDRARRVTAQAPHVQTPARLALARQILRDTRLHAWAFARGLGLPWSILAGSGSAIIALVAAPLAWLRWFAVLQRGGPRCPDFDLAVYQGALRTGRSRLISWMTGGPGDRLTIALAFGTRGDAATRVRSLRRALLAHTQAAPFDLRLFRVEIHATLAGWPHRDAFMRLRFGGATAPP